MKEFLVNIPSSDSAATTYLPVFDDHTVIGARVVPSAVVGAETVVSLISGSTTVGTATIAADAVAGTPIAFEMDDDVTVRKTKIDDETPLIISTDGGQSTATAFSIAVMLDEYALPRD